ncbi:MAG: ACP S-malonyltransferase [Pseudomonadota bacterium]
MNKTAFLFPGQGSQQVGMGLDLLDRYPTAKSTFAEADSALGESLTDLIRNGPEERLKETANAQPAILTVSVAVGRILAEAGKWPDVMAGHSLGEYSALVLSGAMAFADAVRIVRLRGKYMQEAVPLGKGTMAAVLGMEDALVEEVCHEVNCKGFLVEPANYNCPGQLVISGTVEGVNAASELLKAKGCRKCIPLQVSAPFHSSLLKPAGERLAVDLRKITFADPKTPYVANVDASVVRSKEGIVDRLVAQISKPVRWTQSLQRIVSEFAPTQAVEVGPGKVVSGHWKKVAPTVPCQTTESAEILATFLR